MDKDAEATAKRIGATLSAWLETSGLSVMALHKRTGIARNTLYELSAGKRVPSIDVLQRVAAELGTTAGTLLDGTLPDAALAGKASPLFTPPTIDDEKATLSTIRDSVVLAHQNTEDLRKLVQDLIGRVEELEEQRSPQRSASR